MKKSRIVTLFCLVTTGLLWVSCSDPALHNQSNDNPEDTENPSGEAPRQKSEAAEPDTVAKQTLESPGKPSNEVKPPVPEKSDSAEEIEKALAKRQIEIAKFAEIRKEIIGKNFHTLTLADKTFTGVTITNLTDQEICFTHQSGVTNMSWNNVDQKVKDLWGFDQIAFSELQQQHQLAVAEKENYLNSPEYIQSQEKEKRAFQNQKSEESKQRRTAIASRIKELKNQTSRGTAVLSKLKENQRALKASFKKEDRGAAQIKEARISGMRGNGTIGGVNTSKADRDRSLQQLNDKITSAERALEKLYSEIRAEEEKLNQISKG